MTRLEESSTDSHDEMIFPCDCHCDHYLRLTWDDCAEFGRYLWIEQHDAPHGWRRIKAAWSSLRGKDFHQTEMILTPSAHAALLAFLTAKDAA